jgi:NAD(P)-dependent dehydrogenase (short-subunit alcohol dehydrogenase family)
MQRILITGSNRGIGLELARRYVERGEQVIATCRQPDAASELQALTQQHPDRVTVLALDVASTDSIHASYQAVRAQVNGLDILINNAAISPPAQQQALGQIEQDSAMEVFRVNTVGPLLMAQRYADLLRDGKNPRLINVTSRLGSLGHRYQQRSAGSYLYNASKATLNMFSLSLAFDLERQGIITVMVHPGWVRTDMGGRGASLTVAESVSGLLPLIDGLTRNDIGRFYNWNGSELPW